MRPFDFAGLIVSFCVFLLSVIGMFILWKEGDENYWAMLFPLLISIWGIWGAGSLLMEKSKNSKNGENPE